MSSVLKVDTFESVNSTDKIKFNTGAFNPTDPAQDQTGDRSISWSPAETPVVAIGDGITPLDGNSFVLTPDLPITNMLYMTVIYPKLTGDWENWYFFGDVWDLPYMTEATPHGSDFISIWNTNVIVHKVYYSFNNLWRETNALFT